MICIFSYQADDSTDKTIDWINFFSTPFFRCNEFNADEAKRLGLLTEVEAKWYRKINIDENWHTSFKKSNSTLDSIIKHSNKELWAMYISYMQSITSTKILGTLLNRNPNKYNVIKTAYSLGIAVPATIITSSKSEIVQFQKYYPKLITKCAYEAEMFRMSGITWAMYTAPLNEELIKSLPDTFFPSLIQEQIEKEYEIRTFYLEGRCYSMAIFSQSDEQTNIDYRKYNLLKPNRHVPFQLPLEIEEKVKALMNSLQLNTGSLDFIKTPDGHYVFLEVNPSGQFGMVSYPCNYYLERKIAEWLCS